MSNKVQVYIHAAAEECSLITRHARSRNLHPLIKTKHNIDVTSGSPGKNAFLGVALDAGCSRSLQPLLRSHDKASHHTRKDAIPKSSLRHRSHWHGRRSDKPVSCGDDTACSEVEEAEAAR